MLLLLPRIDDDLAAKARGAGCAFCGGRLDVADYPRKPRGADELGDEYTWRRSFCCALDGCRKRRTPVSVRFLGRKVYLGAVVVLATALQRRTLARWCRWWSTMFATSRFWTSLRGRFMPAVEEAEIPASVLSRMTVADEPAVLFELLLARSAHADPALVPRQVGPQPLESRQ